MRLETKEYEVIAPPGKTVFGHVQGERFTASLLEGDEYANLRAGCLMVVEKRPRPPRGAIELVEPVEAPDDDEQEE